MGRSVKRVAAVAATFSLLLSMVPATLASQTRAGRLEGLLLDLDGQPARGYRVVLVDAEGSAVGTATASERGLYTFADIRPGRYGLGIEGPSGAVAPAVVPPVELGAGELARRDIRLMQTSEEQFQDALGANPQVRLWWASRSRREKAAWVAGLVVGVALLWYLLHDDDDDEVPVSSAVLPPGSD